jgi:hypothetical protein
MLLQYGISAIKIYVQVQVGAFKAFFKGLREVGIMECELQHGPVAGSCEHDNELSCSIKSCILLTNDILEFQKGLHAVLHQTTCFIPRSHYHSMYGS